MKQKLTPWFPADVKPVHVGVYQTNAHGKLPYQKWNGKHWCAFNMNMDFANRPQNSNKSAFQEVKWRGLAEKPN